MALFDTMDVLRETSPYAVVEEHGARLMTGSREAASDTVSRCTCRGSAPRSTCRSTAGPGQVDVVDFVVAAEARPRAVHQVDPHPHPARIWVAGRGSGTCRRRTVRPQLADALERFDRALSTVDDT